MAAPPVAPFRVRYGAGAFQLVLLPPGASEAGIERAVAGAVGLAPSTFTIRNLASGATSPFHAGLAGDWEAVLLPAALVAGLEAALAPLAAAQAAQAAGLAAGLAQLQATAAAAIRSRSSSR